MESATRDDQRDWPSFDDILAELKALDRLSTSPLALEPLPTAEIDEASTAPDAEAIETETETDASESDTETTADAAVDEPAGETADEPAVIPDLPDAALDTSALDEPVAVQPAEPEIDADLLDALEPIDDGSTVVDAAPEDHAAPEHVVSEDAVAGESEVDIAPEIDAVVADSDDDSWLEPDFGGETLDWGDTDAGNVFDLESVDTDFDASADAAPEEPSADPEDSPFAEVNELFEDSPAETAPEWAAALEADLGDEAGPTTGDAPVAEVLTGDFDSVATADAIENELSDLFDLDGEEEAEVVPLHAESDDTSDHLVGLDEEVDESGEALPAWEGVDEPEPEDPWAYMRPSEENGQTKGFWASRPKFFGGDERKRRKAERRATDSVTSTSEQTAPDCPSCGATGQIDLDDPVGRRLHASCTSCDHVWSQAYDEKPEAEAS